MATIAKGMITLVNVNDAYSVLVTPNVCSIKADFDGSNPVLDNAYCDITVVRGDVLVPFEVKTVTPSHLGITYTLTANDAKAHLKINKIPLDVIAGNVELEIVTEDEFTSNVIFQYSVVRESTMLDWIKDWETNKTKIGDTYLITPKLFVGKKVEDESSLTGVYIGPNQEAAGMYGYQKGDNVFHIDEKGAYIGGWEISKDGVVTKQEQGSLQILSQGEIVAKDSSDNIIWGLYHSGDATFANGNVNFYKDGSAEFAGKITAIEGHIGSWKITQDTLSGEAICLDASRNYIGIAAYWPSSEDWNSSEGSIHKDWIEQYGGVCLYYDNANYYGIVGYTLKGEETYKAFSLGSDNIIAGWKFDNSALWLGEKVNIAQNYTESGNVTIGTNGLRGQNWYIDSNGDMSFMNGKIHFSVADDGGEIVGWKLNERRFSTNNVALVSDESAMGLYMSVNADANFNSLTSSQFEDYIDGHGGIYMHIKTDSANFAAYDVNGKKLFKLKSNGVSTIARWNFDKDALYTGTKAVYADFTSDNESITISNLGILGYKWKFNQDGSGAIAGGNISWDTSGSVTLDKSVKIEYNNLGGTVINSNGVFAGKISADNITAGTISTADIKQADGAWGLNQDGSGCLANNYINWDKDGNCNFGQWTLDDEYGLYYGDPSNWQLTLSKGTKSLFAPDKMRIQTSDSVNENSYSRVAFGVDSDPNCAHSFGTVGYVYRKDLSGDYAKAFYPAMKISSRTGWGAGVAVATDGAIVAHEGPITERGKVIETDQSVVTMTSLSVYESSTFIVKNNYLDELVYLPHPGEIKHVIGIESDDDCMYTIRLISLPTNKRFKILQAQGDSTTILYNNTLTQTSEYYVNPGDVIEAIYVKNEDTEYWQLIKLT